MPLNFTPYDVALLGAHLKACPPVRLVPKPSRCTVAYGDAAAIIAERDAMILKRDATIRRLIREQGEFIREELEAAHKLMAAEFEAERWQFNWAVAMGALFLLAAGGFVTLAWLWGRA